MVHVCRIIITLITSNSNLHLFLSNCSISDDDDEVPPLSSKFGDIYPVTGYEENSVLAAAVNGLHGDVNGEGETVSLKAGVSPVLWHVALTKCEFPSSLQLMKTFGKCLVYSSSLFTCFPRSSSSLLILPAAVVHQRVTRRKPMVRLVGIPPANRKRIPQERQTVSRPLTTTNRY